MQYRLAFMSNNWNFPQNAKMRGKIGIWLTTDFVSKNSVHFGPSSSNTVTMPHDSTIRTQIDIHIILFLLHIIFTACCVLLQ